MEMISHRHSPFQAVLFDLDDTLYDRGTAFMRWAQDYLHNIYGLTEPAECAAALARIAALDAGGHGSKKAVLEEVCRLYPSGGETMGAEESAALFYDRFFAQLTLDEEAVGLLAALDAANMPWGVITNGQTRQWRKLEQMGLTGRTPCLFVSDTFGCQKPDPAIFLAAAACLKVAPEAILFVGDHPANDIAGAKRVGMQTAWLPRGKPWPAACAGAEPDLTLSGLSQLVPLLTGPGQGHGPRSS